MEPNESRPDPADPDEATGVAEPAAHPARRHAQDPALGEAVQLDPAETLEGDPGDDPLDSGYVPPDRPSPPTRRGVTAEELRDGAPMDERLAEEADAEPDESTRSDRIAPDDDPDSDTLSGRDVGLSGGAASAEEAAMHDSRPESDRE